MYIETPVDVLVLRVTDHSAGLCWLEIWHWEAGGCQSWEYVLPVLPPSYLLLTTRDNIVLNTLDLILNFIRNSFDSWFFFLSLYFPGLGLLLASYLLLTTRDSIVHFKKHLISFWILLGIPWKVGVVFSLRCVPGLRWKIAYTSPLSLLSLQLSSLIHFPHHHLSID